MFNLPTYQKVSLSHFVPRGILSREDDSTSGNAFVITVLDTGKQLWVSAPQEDPQEDY